MAISIIKFRNKNDIFSLPPIPHMLDDEMRILIDTKLNTHLTAFEKLEAVYAYMDKYNAFVATFAVCQKGCSHCCKFDVSVSRLEAEFITKQGGPMLNNGRNMTMDHEQACTFLGKDGACTIYESRPFNCRTFHTLDDPKYCVDGVTHHQVYGIASNGYGSTILATIAGWLNMIHEKHNLPYRDIRDWFPG